MNGLDRMSLEELTINTIRTLAMDGVQKANSGHPGTPMALAPITYTLWRNYLRFNPKNPNWFNRDRFILSNGHASMLIYAMLHLSGYDVSLHDLMNFRQWESLTPGHPEYGLTPGIETTTGPLGQGFATGVGMAMAEAHLAACFNREGHEIVDHYTYALCSDGDLMEGVSHEAASLAGHFGLGKLIYIYDDNLITIEGKTNLTYSDDVVKRFESYHWHVQDIGDNANNLKLIAKVIENAQREKDKPSLIIVRSHIGFGAPNMQDTPEAHGSPLGEEEIRLTKKAYGWPEDAKFLVPEQVLEHLRNGSIDRGEQLESEWREKFNTYKITFPDLAKQLEFALSGNLPLGWDANIPVFDSSVKSIATRSASGKVINAFADQVPWLVGGSGDLSPSTKTLINNSKYFAKGKFENRNFPWGIREHGMCAAVSGMALHGGVRPYASTFFVFTDYARPAIRLAALMKLPVIYVMTHDSIGLGEDGPTHQPVEHLAALRAIPNLCIIRPADANETAYAWRAAMLRQNGPTMLVLSRQNLVILDRAIGNTAEGVLKGAYVLSSEKGSSPDVILIATGSEVHLILAAQKKLSEQHIDARVVSMPSWELFREQSTSYINEVFPSHVKTRLAVEAGSPFGWREWIGDEGEIIGISGFGASAPYEEIYQNFGLSIENIVEKTKKLTK
jgi:transketolase